MNNLFAAIYFKDRHSINLDFYVAKFDPADIVEPIEAYKNGEPIKVSHIPVLAKLYLLRAVKNQTPEDAMLAEVQWDETVARWESHQHDQLDKTLESERCAQ